MRSTYFGWSNITPSTPKQSRSSRSKITSILTIRHQLTQEKMSSNHDDVRVSLDDGSDHDESTQNEEEFEYPHLDKEFGEPVVIMHHVTKGTLWDTF
jgi:hypothetical protein